MSSEFWIRLVGCIVIELAGACLFSADAQYKAGVATLGQTRALVLEDRRGNRAAIAQAGFPVSRGEAEFAAIQLIRDFSLAREALLILGAGAGTGRAQNLTAVVTAALVGVEPVSVRFGNGVLSVTDPGGGCRASLSHEQGLRFDGCVPGKSVGAPIRGFFQIVEPDHGLQRRGEAASRYPIQAIALGRQAVLLGLSGEVPAERFAFPRVIVLPFSNGADPLPADARVEKAIESLLRRAER